MNKNLTDITLLIDRSGSMQSIKGDAEGGVNALIQSQKTGAGKVNFTLIEFSYPTDYNVVWNAVPIEQINPTYVLNPKGGTALLDALAKAIIQTGERIGAMNEADRPGLVLFTVLSDGAENASKTSTLQQVKAMITHQTEKYSWVFQYLASNIDAIQVGGSLGFGTSANYTNSNTRRAYAAASNSISRMREQTTSGGIVIPEYTKEELKSMIS